MIQLSPPASGSSSFGGGTPYGAATGRTANFGYGSLSNGVKPMRGPMGMGAKNTAAPFQGVPDQPIGIQPAAAGTSQKPSGGGGMLSRGMQFIKGLGEGGGEAEGGAAAAGGAGLLGGGGGAAAAGAVEELAPLALLAA